MLLKSKVTCSAVWPFGVLLCHLPVALGFWIWSGRNTPNTACKSDFTSSECYIFPQQPCTYNTSPSLELHICVIVMTATQTRLHSLWKLSVLHFCLLFSLCKQKMFPTLEIPVKDEPTAASPACRRKHIAYTLANPLFTLHGFRSVCHFLELSFCMYTATSLSTLSGTWTTVLRILFTQQMTRPILKWLIS